MPAILFLRYPYRRPCRYLVGYVSRSRSYMYYLSVGCLLVANILGLMYKTVIFHYSVLGYWILYDYWRLLVQGLYISQDPKVRLHNEDRAGDYL